MKSVYLGFTLFTEKVLRKGGHCSNDFFKSYIFKMCDVSKFFKVVTYTNNGCNCQGLSLYFLITKSLTHQVSVFNM